MIAKRVGGSSSNDAIDTNTLHTIIVMEMMMQCSSKVLDGV